MKWLVINLRALAYWLENKSSSNDGQLKFKDLAPIDDADKNGVYSDAIRFALSREKVSNIALTGPYGSGKSSIIQSFLKLYGKPVLQISLASFVSGTEADAEAGTGTKTGSGKEGKVTRQEIERSILQQMLYGADSNKLPFSRFKRIQSPGAGSAFKSFFIMAGMLSVWYVLSKQDDIISGEFFIPASLSNWKNYLSIFIAVPFLWRVLHHFYVASFGLSLKSISLKDVEIKPDRDDQESILNRHLDEIIYFFQSTKYDLVIIEDLDRFNDAEVFVTLREINKLVNDNSKVKRPVRFLYALRDDMFINTERTKFFEFIIPVIPIINTSNSIDMVLEQGKRLELEERFDRQFLREVSRYLNDLRLIQNIFNEYSIYIAELEKDQEGVLDPNKLLSVLIYKNVYPKDFEQLHRGEGSLSDIIGCHDELVELAEVGLRNELSDLERKLEASEKQISSDLKELRKIYAMTLIQNLPNDATMVRIDSGDWVSVRELADCDNFAKFISTNRLFYRDQYGNYSRAFDASKIEFEVDSSRAYQQRVVEVERKEKESKDKILRRIDELKSKISSLRATKLHELLRLNPERTLDLFDNFERNGELARFLVLEGYLDDTYYQYTSLFHKGRLSPNDNKFLIQIRAYIEPKSDFPIDNPKEVIASMRDEDFGQAYVLNIKIVDTLLSSPAEYCEHTRKLFELISNDFEGCEDFLESYYSNGRYVPHLLAGLSEYWEGFVATVIASHNNISHIGQLVARLSEDSLSNLGRNNEELPEFVSLNLHEILSRFPEVEVERFVCLDFEVKDFEAIREYPQIARSMFNKGLFELTIQNLEYVYQEILHEGELSPMRERNLTTILSTGNEALIGRIESDFNIYVSRILLELDDNSKEAVPAILKVLECEDLDENSVRQFLECQVNPLPSLDGVPERLYVMLFDTVSVEAAWENCLAFMNSKVFSNEVLLNYLNQDVVREVIINNPISGDEDSKKLCRFIFEASPLSDMAYRKYVSALPWRYNYIPNGLEETKLRILIEERRISFNKKVFDNLNDYRDLQILFVERNIVGYLQDPEVFDLSDDFLEDLLRTGIKGKEKLSVVKLMDLSALISLPERAGFVGSVVNAEDAKIPGIDADVARSLIVNSDPMSTQISLFNKYHSIMDDGEVRGLLGALPKPYCEIKIGHLSPRLDNTSENMELVEWLDSRNIISSWSHQTGFFSGDYIKVNLYRK